MSPVFAWHINYTLFIDYTPATEILKVQRLVLKTLDFVKFYAAGLAPGAYKL
jgi:hypothetical protein